MHSSQGMALLEWRLVVGRLTPPGMLTAPSRLTSPGMLTSPSLLTSPSTVIAWTEMLASVMCIASKTAFTWVRGLNATFLPLLTMGKWTHMAVKLSKGSSKSLNPPYSSSSGSGSSMLLPPRSSLGSSSPGSSRYSAYGTSSSTVIGSFSKSSTPWTPAVEGLCICKSLTSQPSWSKKVSSSGCLSRALSLFTWSITSCGIGKGVKLWHKIILPVHKFRNLSDPCKLPFRPKQMELIDCPTCVLDGLGSSDVWP